MFHLYYLYVCVGCSNKTKLQFPVFEILEADKDIWNGFIEQLDHSRSFFSTRWLYAECYMYRRLKSIFEMTYAFKINLIDHQIQTFDSNTLNFTTISFLLSFSANR